MNELKIFENAEFGKIRTFEQDGKYLLCGTDVARALGYSIPSKAVNTHCKGVSKMEAPTSGGVQKLLFIPEGDVYRLIVHSKLPSAERFERWVYDEVLPSIRQHGAYMTDTTLEQALTNPDFLIQLATKLKEEREARKKLEEQAERDKPKVIFADAVASSETSILIGDLAKLLRQNGINTGQKRLFSQLREQGYLIKSGASKNIPTQRSMEMGLFEIKEGSYVDGNGCNITTKTTKVTGKGQQYFINKFLNGKEKTFSQKREKAAVFY